MLTAYCDTSLLVAALTREQHGEAARAWLGDKLGGGSLVSD